MKSPLRKARIGGLALALALLLAAGGAAFALSVGQPGPDAVSPPRNLVLEIKHTRTNLTAQQCIEDCLNRTRC